MNLFIVFAENTAKPNKNPRVNEREKEWVYKSTEVTLLELCRVKFKVELTERKRRSVKIRRLLRVGASSVRTSAPPRAPEACSRGHASGNHRSSSSSAALVLQSKHDSWRQHPKSDGDSAAPSNYRGRKRRVKRRSERWDRRAQTSGMSSCRGVFLSVEGLKAPRLLSNRCCRAFPSRVQTIWEKRFLPLLCWLLKKRLKSDHNNEHREETNLRATAAKDKQLNLHCKGSHARCRLDQRLHEDADLVIVLSNQSHPNFKKYSTFQMKESSKMS